MNISDIEESGVEILALLRAYQYGPLDRRETRIDPVVLGYFQGRFGKMSRQHYVRMHSKPKPQRIDFRHGTHNPVVIELAVRPPSGLRELYGSQNKSELRKLTRVLPSQARLRVLLLLDLFHKPIPLANLKATYDVQNAGRGKFKRHRVRVIYVHKDVQYNFSWDPKTK